MSLTFRLETALLATVLAAFSAGCSGGGADTAWATDTDPTVDRPTPDSGSDSGLDSGNDSGNDSADDTGPDSDDDTADDSGHETGEDSDDDTAVDSGDTGVADHTAVGRSIHRLWSGLWTGFHDLVVEGIEALREELK